MKEYGVAFHCHHVELVEVVTRFSKRVAYIKIGKPRREHPLRLRLFRMIPDNRLPVAVRRALIPARTAWAKLKLLDDDYDAKHKLLEEAIQTAMPKLEKLHAELCPDCPWDGKTIFARSN